MLQVERVQKGITKRQALLRSTKQMKLCFILNDLMFFSTSEKIYNNCLVNSLCRQFFLCTYDRSKSLYLFGVKSVHIGMVPMFLFGNQVLESIDDERLEDSHSVTPKLCPTDVN